MQRSRERGAPMGEEARRIQAERRYATTTGAVVELGAQLDLAVAGTRSYPAEHVLATERQGQHETVITVRNESTLAAARRLAGAGKRPVALNFASAKHPGGGPFERAFG